MVLTGGVSVGKYDLVEQVLKKMGVEFFFDALAIRPGRPAVFGACDETPVFGLPGNPVSTMVTFELLVVPAIESLSGHQPGSLHLFKAKLAHPVDEKPPLAHFLPARVKWPGGEPTVEVLHWEGSGDIGSVVRGNCFLVVHESKLKLEAGEMVDILPRRGFFKNFAMKKLSHYDKAGRVNMVDVSRKPTTSRAAVAHAFVRMQRATIASIRRLKSPKGNPLEIARIAGITAAKRTSELIPLCHPLALTHVDVTAKLCQNGIEVTSAASATGPTGVEMEALVAAAVAALTIYDMCKALERGMEITELYLIEKSGGRSGRLHPRRKKV